jgi:plastocyanin
MIPSRKLVVFAIVAGLALSQWGLIIHLANGATVSVKIQNFAFNPQNVTIQIGYSVTWTNNDPVIYTLWFKNATDGSSYLLSQPINPGTTWTHTFPDKIRLNYYDFDRLQITGQLTVIVPTGTVGGVLVPVDRLALLTPLVGLASLVVAATTVTAIYARRAKHRKGVNRMQSNPQQSRFLPDER